LRFLYQTQNLAQPAEVGFRKEDAGPSMSGIVAILRYRIKLDIGFSVGKLL
jgi:hypothetical protein